MDFAFRTIADQPIRFQRAEETLVRRMELKHQGFGGTPTIHPHGSEHQAFVPDGMSKHIHSGFLFAVRVGIVNAIVNDPKSLQRRIDINAGHDPDAVDNLTCVSAPLTMNRLDVERVAFIQDCVVKEQVSVLVRD